MLFETEKVLKELKNLRKAVADSKRMLSRYDGLTMVNSYHKGSTKQQYYLKQNGKPAKKKYIGTGESETVKKIKAAKYYSTLLNVIDTDIHLLESVEKDYVIPDHASINELLPKVYRIEGPIQTLHASREAAKWKESMEAEKAKYEPYKPEDLIYMARDGTRMRSLSEVIIANYLLSLGITFVYELPLVVNGRRIWPDFTILSPIDNRTVIIIEHQGAMSSEKYQSKYIRTLLFYLETDMVPNKDVFFTFNHLDGNLDIRQIDSILQMAFGYGQ